MAGLPLLLAALAFDGVAVPSPVRSAFRFGLRFQLPHHPSNAGMSSGLREVTRPESTTTSSSTQSPPALRISVCRLGKEVTLRPSTTSASISIQGAWQIAPIGLPAAKNSRRNRTVSSSVRRLSGLATPPGSTTPS